MISTPLQVRTEGITERFGDITLVCTGGAPGSLLSGNLILFFPVLVTNRVDTSNLTHDAAVSIDTGSGFVPSAVPGLVSSNSISFNGLSFMTPTGNISLKISGIRGAVNQLGLTTQQPVLASLSGSLPLNQAQVVVAYPLISLQATLNDRGITCTGSPTPGGTISQSSLYGAGTAFSSTRLTEGYASAFETRQPGTDNGVRILLKYSGFPANAHIYIPDAVAGSDAASPTSAGDLGLPPSLGQYVPGSNTLVLVRVNGADANGAGGFQVFPPQGTGPQTLNAASEVQLTNGSGYAVYEVADANPAVQETAQFPTFITLPSVAAPAVAQESVSLAPVSSVLGASTSAPIVRFVNANVPSDCSTLGDCGAPYFPRLAVDATPIQISAIAQGGKMTSAPGYIPIRNSGGGLLEWTVSINYQTGGTGWLFVDYPEGSVLGSVRVWSDTTKLNAGTYLATVTINAGSAGSQTIPVTLTVAAAPPPPPPPPPVAPTVTVSQVVNAATFKATPLVAGSLATVMGSHFSGKNMSVTFDGAAARVLFTNDTQINLQVPASLGPKTQASVVVTVDDKASAPTMVTLSPASPAVFDHGVLNQDNSVNGGEAAARSGDILQIFATGIPLGAVVSAQIGDRRDLVPVYAGDAPDVPGVQQVNVAVPQGLGAGASLTLCATVTGGQQFCSTGYPLVLK